MSGAQPHGDGIGGNRLAQGRRIDAKPSCPMPTVARLAATLAPVPPDDPPGVRSGAYGLRVIPKSDPYVSPPPHSPSVLLPRMIAPAWRSFATANASRAG